MRLETRAVGIGERSLQVVGDHIDQLLACHLSGSVIVHGAFPSVSKLAVALRIFGEIRLHSSAQAAAAAVQEHALIGLAQPKHVANFGRGPPMHVAKSDHDALRWWQAIQLPPQDSHHLAANDSRSEEHTSEL